MVRGKAADPCPTTSPLDQSKSRRNPRFDRMVWKRLADQHPATTRELWVRKPGPRQRDVAADHQVSEGRSAPSAPIRPNPGAERSGADAGDFETRFRRIPFKLLGARALRRLWTSSGLLRASSRRSGRRFFVVPEATGSEGEPAEPCL